MTPEKVNTVGFSNVPSPDPYKVKSNEQVDCCDKSGHQQLVQVKVKSAEHMCNVCTNVCPVCLKSGSSHPARSKREEMHKTPQCVT